MSHPIDYFFRTMLLSAGVLASSLPAQIQATEPVPATKLDKFTVSAPPVPGENKVLGSYAQPEWTGRRRFVTTRVYVQPEDEAEVELGFDFAHPADGPSTTLLRQEIEYGLPHRFQIDLENTFQNFREGGGDERSMHHDSTAVELRYALADWNKLPLNPTLSFAWKANRHAADAAEVQLLLGTELSPRWHWGVNFIHEQQVGGDRHREQAISQGLSYSLINEKVNVGAEIKYNLASDFDTRGHPEKQLTLGPSVQWRPTDRTHLDLVPMWGASHAAPHFEVFLFFGFEFGAGSDDGDDHPKVEPASLRGR